MTLILSLATEDYVIQVADRRLSSNGKLVDDESNKAGFLVSDNAQLLFGFTGIARYGSFDTRKWILKTLYDSSAVEILDIFENFRTRANDFFNKSRLLKKVPPAHKRLSVMFTGYINRIHIGNCIISNFQDFELGVDYPECREHFIIHTAISKPEELHKATFIQRVGAWGAMDKSDEEVLRQMLEEKKPRIAVLDKAVSLVRDMADSPQAYGTIGKQINSTCLEKGDPAPVSQYHTKSVKNETYMSDMVDVRSSTPNIAVSDIKIESHGKPISIPKVPKNHPCPCGSGKKYKRCHMRRKRSVTR